MNLQVFNYNNSPITFQLESGDVMVNATEMAKPFGKLPGHFISNQQTKEFIGALESRYRNSDNANFQAIMVRQGGLGQQGTWMHQKLALKFAGWLNPEFELWVYDQIETLLTKGKVELPTNPNFQIPATYSQALMLAAKQAEIIETQTQQMGLLESANEVLQEEIKTTAPIVSYAKEVLSAQGGMTTTQVAMDLGMSAVRLNRLLKEAGVQRKVGGEWVLTSKYLRIEDKFAITRTVAINRSTGADTVRQLLWTEKGRQLINTILTPTKQVA